jgi:hypothetical protein
MHYDLSGLEHLLVRLEELVMALLGPKQLTFQGRLLGLQLLNLTS